MKLPVNLDLCPVPLCHVGWVLLMKDTARNNGIAVVCLISGLVDLAVYLFTRQS